MTTLCENNCEEPCGADFHVTPGQADAIERGHETTIRNLVAERQGERDADAGRARDLVADSMDKSSAMYRLHGADRLLAAAQVYATLAMRP